MKILVVLPSAKGVYPPAAETQRENCVRSYSRDGLQVDVDYPKPSGFVAFGEQLGDAFNFARNHMVVAERMIEGEREGYDACVPYGMLDFGVEIARNVCNIPVVGQAHAAYCMAALMADRVGVISYHSSFNGYLRRQIEGFGFGDRIVGFGAAEMSNADMPRQRDLLFERFTSEGKRLVGMGAEVIVAHGMSMSPGEFTAREFGDTIGAPVLEGLGCAIAMAQAWVQTGTPYSRQRYKNMAGK